MTNRTLSVFTLFASFALILLLIPACSETRAPTQPTRTMVVFIPSPSTGATAAPPATSTNTAAPEIITFTETPLPTEIPIQSTNPPPAGQEYFAVVGVAPDDTLIVRTAAGVLHPIVGQIPPYGTGILITGEPVMVDGSSWVPIHFQDVSGWVNRKYLARQLGEIDDSLAQQAQKAIWAIKNRDMTTLASLVHPQSGLRFSPYAYVQDKDLVFATDQVKNLLQDPTSYLWGSFDGSGLPIEMTFSEYFGRFLYDQDFAQPEYIGLNQVIGGGNMINNIQEFYPQATFIEYHFTGFDPQYGGMDWRSLRLVFEQVDGDWRLVGIIHDEWTT